MSQILDRISLGRMGVAEQPVPLSESTETTEEILRDLKVSLEELLRNSG